MNAAETSASSAIAHWTPLTVVSRSSTTAAIDTFISDVSTTSTNIAIASRTARPAPLPSAVVVAAGLRVGSCASAPDVNVSPHGESSASHVLAAANSRTRNPFAFPGP